MAKIRETFFLVLATFYVVFLIIPIFSFFIGLNISVVSIVTFAGMLLLYPKAFLNKTSVLGLIYLSILFLYYLGGKDLPSLGAGENPTLMRIIMATAFVIPNLAIYYILKHLNSERMYRYFCWMPIAVLIISFATFTPLIIGHNEVLRQVTYTGGEFSTDPRLPHYSLLHAYVLIMPALILAVKVIKTKLRYIFLLVAIYDFYVIAQSSVAVTIVLAVISIAFMLIYDEKDNNKSLLRTLGFGALFFLFIEVGIVDAVMNMLVNLYDDTAAAGKMRLFRDMLSGNELAAGNSLDTRRNLHNISINAFFANPLIGSSPVGNHSCILDRLGGLGLIGFVPYVIFLFSVFKNVAKTFVSRNAKMGFYVVSFSVLLLLYQKGLFGQECWLFFIVLAPSILHYIENKTILKKGIPNVR